MNPGCGSQPAFKQVAVVVYVAATANARNQAEAAAQRTPSGIFSAAGHPRERIPPPRNHYGATFGSKSDVCRASTLAEFFGSRTTTVTCFTYALDEAFGCTMMM
jgi:hypothetical protein